MNEHAKNVLIALLVAFGLALCLEVRYLVAELDRVSVVEMTVIAQGAEGGMAVTRRVPR